MTVSMPGLVINFRKWLDLSLKDFRHERLENLLKLVV